MTNPLEQFELERAEALKDIAAKHIETLEAEKKVVDAELLVLKKAFDEEAKPIKEKIKNYSIAIGRLRADARLPGPTTARRTKVDYTDVVRKTLESKPTTYFSVEKIAETAVELGLCEKIDNLVPRFQREIRALVKHKCAWLEAVHNGKSYDYCLADLPDDSDE